MSEGFPPGGANPYQSTPAPGRAPVTSGKAIASLILGLLSFVFCCLAGIPAIVLGALGVSQINRSNGQVKGSGLAITGIVLGSIGTISVILLPALLLPAVQAARQAARRNQSSNHMKLIGLALINFHDVNRAFPPAFTKDADGRPLLSWRVAILPYLEEGALSQQFHADEPWDGPDNKPLVVRRPSYYNSPGDETSDSGQTNFVGIVDSDTILSDDGPVTMRDIRDGTSKTIVAVELAGTGVQWSEPQDITIDEFVAAMRNPHGPGLHTIYPGGAICLFADGSVDFISSNTDPGLLRAMCTRSGGEPVTRPID
jgi:hypothetical protein